MVIILFNISQQCTPVTEVKLRYRYIERQYSSKFNYYKSDFDLLCDVITRYM